MLEGQGRVGRFRRDSKAKESGKEIVLTPLEGRAQAHAMGEDLLFFPA